MKRFLIIYILPLILLIGACKKDVVEITISSPQKGSSFAAGNQINIKWESDITSNVIIKLYYGFKEIQLIADNVPSNSYSWNLPVTLEAGSYRIYIQSKTSPELYEFSPSFTIGQNSATIDPTQYSGIPLLYKTIIFDEQFTNNNNSWITGSVAGSYNNTIANGVYTINNLNTSQPYYYQVANKFSEQPNFEIEYRIKVLKNNSTSYYNTMMWGFANSTSYYEAGIATKSLYFFAGKWANSSKTIFLESALNYMLPIDYNKITIRQYNKMVYYFLNENYVGLYASGAFYGSNIAFNCAPLNQFSIDYLVINKIN